MASQSLLVDARIAIIGLGLMGGSLAMALRGKCSAIYAADPDARVVSLARKQELADLITQDPAEILPRANLVILAAPIKAIIQQIQSMPDLHPGEAVIIDIGSTKLDIIEAMERLPERFDPLGGHPMCGKEKLGFENADSSLYDGATFAFTPCEQTSENAIQLANQLANAVGAGVLLLDAATHDRWVGATSHFPHLLSAALMLATPLEASPLIGPGFHSMTRLAATPPTLTMDILTTNRENILDSLDRFSEQLNHFRSLLNTHDDRDLQIALELSTKRRSHFIGGEGD
jgi:prephenate dehydrogenase